MHDQCTAPEEWRPVVGYEGWYSISNHGRVRRDMPGRATQVGRILRQALSRDGYLSVELFTGSGASSRKRKVHQLAAEAFIGLRPRGCGVNHISGVKTDNRPENLEWATPAENSAHGARTGLMASGDRSSRRSHPESYPYGEQHQKAKLTEDAVRDILSSPLRQEALAAKYGVSQVAISRVRLRKTWRHINAM